MLYIGNIIKIMSTNNTLKFICIADGIYSREVEFGMVDEDEDEDEILENEFYSEQLHKIIKLSGLGSKLYVYIKEDNPLMIKCLIGSLGYINIYIKNIKQINSDEIN